MRGEKQTGKGFCAGSSVINIDLTDTDTLAKC